MSWGEIKELLTLSLPRTIGLAVHQIAMIVLIALASRIESGSIAVFTLATNLHNIPLMIIGSSYAVAAFPTLAKLYGKGDSALFLEQLLKAVRHIIFWSAPAIVMFIVVRAQIVRTIFGSGAFDWTATRLTAAALALFMFSLIAHSLVLLFARGYYAMGNTRLPLIANTTGALFMIGSAFLLLHLYETHIAMRYFFEELFRVDGLTGTHILMLPLSYSLGMILSMSIYFFHLRRLFPNAVGQTRRTVLHAGGASIFAGYIAYHTLTVLAPVLDTNTFIGIFSQGALATIAGMIGWAALLRIMGNTELFETLSTFRDKIWKTTRPIAGEPEEL
jgi:putative peptidoglycan lipid II flippase